MSKTATKTKNTTIHSDEIVTVHSDVLYKIGKTLESLYAKTHDLNNRVSDRSIDGRAIEKALDGIDGQIDKAFTDIKTILIENEIVSGASYSRELPPKKA
jgi:hypothetical protein